MGFSNSKNRCLYMEPTIEYDNVFKSYLPRVYNTQQFMYIIVYIYICIYIYVYNTMWSPPIISWFITLPILDTLQKNKFFAG